MSVSGERHSLRDLAWFRDPQFAHCAQAPLQGVGVAGISILKRTVHQQQLRTSACQRKLPIHPPRNIPHLKSITASVSSPRCGGYRSARAFEGLNLVLFRRDWPAECVGESRRHEEKEAPEIDAPAVELPNLDF